FGNKVYRLIRQPETKTRMLASFPSSTYMQEKTCEKSVVACIRINTMDFYKEESNQVLYEKLVEFIKESKTTGIDTLHPSFKIALDYTITKNPENTLSDTSGGIRYIQLDAEEANVLLNMDVTTNELPYRIASYLHKQFVIDKLTNCTYGVMDPKPKCVDFKINNIQVLASLADASSKYYLQDLGPSHQNTTFGRKSGIVETIEMNSIVLFDAASFHMEFPTQRIPYLPETICVDVEMLLNQYCAVYNDAMIWKLISENAVVDGSVKDDIHHHHHHHGSYFDPVVNRKPCHGNYPFPPSRPRKPGIHCDVLPPTHHSKPCFPPHKPLRPGDEWDNDQSIVPTPSPDSDQEPGSLNENEWCIADETTTNGEKFLVVVDQTPDDQFDSTEMVRYSDVKKYVADVVVGDYVTRQTVLYY
ncbi:MAG: hypothetical protein K2L37_07215, partial [Lactobacillus sp.]|nr:hypothetical protein [Lactobacillus sp.]